MESKNYLNGQLDGKHEKNYEDLELYFNGFEDKEFCFTYKNGELIEEYFNDFHLSKQTNHGFRKYYKKGKKIKETTWDQVMKYPIDTIDNNIDTEFIPNKYNFIAENTPNGTVFMRYDKNNEGFDYWCDDNQIEYKYLETVARKFIKIFNCKHLYFDREKDIQQQKLELELKDLSNNSPNKNEIVNNADDNDNVFVKPKPIVNNNKKEKQKKNDNTIIPRNSNKFIKKGKVNELTNTLLFPTGKIVKKNKKFSFSDYKKLFK